jgi:hypothetical protein
MSQRSSARKPITRKPDVERRAPRGDPGSLRWLKGLLGRPLALERRQGRLHMSLLDRRRSPAQIEADELEALRQELQTRLLGHELAHAARVMRHLVFVHDALGRNGWPGVAVMPSPVLGKALLQVDMLHSRERSPVLAEMAERLRMLKAAAEVREERQDRRTRESIAGHVEVTEATHEEFEETERSWVGSLPPALRRPDPEA